MSQETLLPLLLEIGTEEIPARFLPSAISDLKRLAAEIFGEYRLGYEGINAFATPRRLVLIVTGIPSRQRDMVKEVFGPGKNAAFDSEGNPTKAATGFAASLGIKTSDLTIKNKGKGEYVAAIIEEKGVETGAVLPAVLKKIILSLRFPKAMRWGDRDMTFVRPIHWFVTLFGRDAVEIEIDGIKSSAISRGHRFLAPAFFQIREIDAYENLLEKNFVIVDHEKRKKIIRDGINALAAASGGQPVMDEELLELVTFLVEFPVPVLCGFSAEYLKLPKELLITVMKDHQKYFAVQDAEGNLLDKFIVISNTRAENGGTVRIGAERVIRARFDDAKFYFHEDGKIRLIDRVEDLKKVTFHDELGSLFEKMERVASMAEFLAERLVPNSKDSLIRAARLSKTDLITGVVGEFPELQGVMGKYYAGHDGEEKDVAEALEEQYLPKSFGGRLPQTELGALLSLADKIDSVASFFAIGLVPTGSEDPFALRRQAMGIVSILLDKGYATTLEELSERALQNLSRIPFKGDVRGNIANFMEQRVEFILSSAGHDQEIIKSVLSLASSNPLRTVIGRIEALKKFKGDEIFPDFLLAIKRVINIIPKTPLPPVKEELFSLEEEKNLYGAVMTSKDWIKPVLGDEDFYKGLRILSDMTAPINNFFDRVLVMDKQEEIKNNRLALLKEIRSLASTFADFSKLQ